MGEQEHRVYSIDEVAQALRLAEFDAESYSVLNPVLERMQKKGLRNVCEHNLGHEELELLDTSSWLHAS